MTRTSISRRPHWLELTALAFRCSASNNACALRHTFESASSHSCRMRLSTGGMERMSASTRLGPGSWGGSGSTWKLSTRATSEASLVNDSCVAKLSLHPWNTCGARACRSHVSITVRPCFHGDQRARQSKQTKRAQLRVNDKHVECLTRISRLGCCWKGMKRWPSKLSPCSLPAFNARRRSVSSLTTSSSTTSPADSSRSCRQWHRSGRS
eukprot:2586868-Rhodomonas_salina.2